MWELYLAPQVTTLMVLPVPWVMVWTSARTRYPGIVFLLSQKVVEREI
ncbi:MAG: hypothetical protein ABIM17_03600 [candidate division WOR-3 bacterium]